MLPVRIFSGVAGLMLIAGCASTEQISHKVIAAGSAVGLKRPYENERTFATSRPTLHTALLEILNRRGTQIVAVDSNSGVVSWADIGAAFIPIAEREDVHSDGRGTRLAPSLSAWRAIVYGNARIKDVDGGAYLLLRAVARERTTGAVSFSDGTYERGLLLELGRQAARRGVAEGLVSTPPGLSGPAPKSYAELYTRNFRNAPATDPDIIRKIGRREIFPTNRALVWEACLDVVAQFDSLIQVSTELQRAIFAHSIAVAGLTKGQDASVDVNVLMALQVDARGKDGATLSIALLAPEDLSLRPVVDLARRRASKGSNLEALTPIEAAAALVADDLLTKVATQLYYMERWSDKFQRRAVR